MAIPKRVLVFFLFERRRESAIVATTTKWTDSAGSGFQIREPAAHDGESFNILMMDGEGDMPVRLLSDADKFYAWLQSEQGWAAIDEDVARDIMPQWLIGRECQPVGTEDFYIDRTLLSETNAFASKVRTLFGPEASLPEDFRLNFMSDLMVASFPL